MGEPADFSARLFHLRYSSISPCRTGVEENFSVSRGFGGNSQRKKMASSDSFSSCLEDLTCRLPSSFFLPVFLMLSLMQFRKCISFFRLGLKPIVIRPITIGGAMSCPMHLVHTGFSSEIGTKLRDWAVGQAGGSCYSWAALSSNDSKTR